MPALRTIPLAALIALAAAPVGVGSGAVLLQVDDGAFFYDTNGDCVGDTNGAFLSVALHHWHYAAPMLTHEHEATGGFGCLGAPRAWTVQVPEGATARVEGAITYSGDVHFTNTCCTDVHLLVTDADGVAYSSLLEEGPDPVVKVVAPVKTRAIDASLGPGSYTLTEDIATGMHNAWLTRLVVTLE